MSSSATQVIMRRWLARTEGVAALSAVAIAGVLAGTAVVVAGGGAVQSALLGVGAVVLFFGLGAAFEILALRWYDSLGLLVLLAGYSLRVSLLTATASWMLSAAWLPSPSWFAIGIVAATIAWLAGLVIGHMSGRWPIYDLAVMV